MKELFIETRTLVYLDRHTDGLSGDQIVAWLRSLRKYAVTIQDAEQALRKLRDEGLVLCTNKLWYRRRKVNYEQARLQMRTQSVDTSSHHDEPSTIMRQTRLPL